MDSATVSTITIHLEKDGSPLPQASVTAFNTTKQADDFGTVTYTNVPGGKQLVVIKNGDKTYSVPVYVLSPEIEINLTSVQPTVAIPSDRQVAYQKAAGSMPYFIVMMVLLGLLIALVVHYFNKRFAFLPAFVRWLVQMILIVVLLIAGIFVTAYANGSQDTLFAMMTPLQSTEASGGTVKPPINVKAVGGKNTITLVWQSEAEDTLSRAYVIRWGKSASEVQRTRMTNVTSTKLNKLDANTEYMIEIQAVEIGGSVTKLSLPVEVTAKTE